jgi:hypothetical protein
MIRITSIMLLSLVVASGRSAEAQAVRMEGQLPATQPDVKTFARTADGNWRSEVVGPDGVKREYVYEPPNKVAPRVEVALSVAESDVPIVSYRYTISNDAKAKQALARFFLLGTLPVTAKDVPSVWYWQTPPDKAGLIFSGRIVEDRLTGIPPGEVVHGPVVEGPVLPGVVTARTMGNPSRTPPPAGLTDAQRDDLVALAKPGFVDLRVIGPAIPIGYREPELTYDVVLSRVGMHYTNELKNAAHPDAAAVEAIFQGMVKEGAANTDPDVRKGLEKLLAMKTDRLTDPWHRQLSEALAVCARVLLKGNVPVRDYRP